MGLKSFSVLFLCWPEQNRLFSCLLKKKHYYSYSLLTNIGRRYREYLTANVGKALQMRVLSKSISSWTSSCGEQTKRQPFVDFERKIWSCTCNMMPGPRKCSERLHFPASSLSKQSTSSGSILPLMHFSGHLISRGEMLPSFLITNLSGDAPIQGNSGHTKRPERNQNYFQQQIYEKQYTVRAPL